MLDATSQATALLRCANALDGLREELWRCEQQLGSETGIVLWSGRARREYDAQVLHLTALADRLRDEILLLTSDLRLQASVMVSGLFE